MQGDRNYVRQTADKEFRPCHVRPMDERFPNGIFVFNITKLIEHIDRHADRFPIEIASIAPYARDDERSLDQAHIPSADLTKPIILAEISPTRFNLVDGHHRVARAKREGILCLPAYRVWFPVHVQFLTARDPYFAYFDYWNDKVDALHEDIARGRRTA